MCPMMRIAWAPGHPKKYEILVSKNTDIPLPSHVRPGHVLRNADYAAALLHTFGEHGKSQQIFLG